MDIRLLDVSAVLGLCVTVTLTLNIILGMMLSTGYKKTIWWKKLPAGLKKIPLVNLHNWTAYLSLLLALLHPVFLIADKDTVFRPLDMLYPIHARYQRLDIIFGSLSLYALIAVVITTQKTVKRRMGFRFWKNVHLISYGTAVLFIVHGILIDPELKGRPVDWLDGEKLVPEICAVVLIIAIITRYRWHLHHRTNVDTPEFH